MGWTQSRLSYFTVRRWCCYRISDGEGACTCSHKILSSIREMEVEEKNDKAPTRCVAPSTSSSSPFFGFVGFVGFVGFMTRSTNQCFLGLRHRRNWAKLVRLVRLVRHSNHLACSSSPTDRKAIPHRGQSNNNAHHRADHRIKSTPLLKSLMIRIFI